MGTDWFGQAAERVDGDNDDGEIFDLHAEHVTPYGAWLSFASSYFNEYGYYVEAGWSRQPFSSWGEVEGSARNFAKVHKAPGEKPRMPLIIFDFEPNTTYYIRIRREGENDLSNMLTITTSPDPRPALTGLPTHDSTLLAHWRGDSEIQSRIGAARASLRNQYDHAPLAALIYQVTGSNADRNRARDLLFNHALPYHENNALTGNQYRWAKSYLANSASLMWSDLSSAERNRVAEALLSDDERSENLTYTSYIQDTDQYRSDAAVQITNGLLQTQAPSAAIRQRGEFILREGLRKFYGMMLVTMRRDQGWNAGSGGLEPDSSDYGRGSETYTMRAIWALLSAGASDIDPYWQYVWNSLRGQNLYAVTPSGMGSATYGDVEGYPAQFDEPWSEEIYTRGPSMKFGLLWRMDKPVRAAYAKGFIELGGGDDGYWALATANAGVNGRDRNDLTTTYATRSKGVVFDRTGWGNNDSMLSIWCGPGDIDHKQPDDGDWAWYVNGEWMVHELPEYSHQSQWHSTPILPGTGGRAQYSSNDTAGQASFTSFDATADRLTVSMDLLPVYNSYRQGFRGYQEVTRTIVWLKGINAVVVRDLVRGEGVSGTRKSAIMTDKNVSITGLSATFGGATLDTVGASRIRTSNAPNGMTRIEVEYAGDEIITVVQEGSLAVNAVAGGVRVGNQTVTF